MKIEMVVKKLHKFGGKLRTKGEHYEATPAEAKVVEARGFAVRFEPPPVVEAPKREYKRRDLKAESTDPVVEAQAAPRSMVAEVERVKDDYRARYTGAPSPAMREAPSPKNPSVDMLEPVSRETLTRPKKAASAE